MLLEAAELAVPPKTVRRLRGSSRAGWRWQLSLSLHQSIR